MEDNNRAGSQERELHELVPNKPYYSAVELYNSTFDDADFWLWKDRLVRGAINFLVGGSDVGKSTFLRQLALTYALQRDEMLGVKLLRSDEPPIVVYVSTEDGVLSLIKSLKTHVPALGLEQPPDNLYFVVSSENVRETVARLIGKNKRALAIFDAWSDIFKGNPNDFQSVRADFQKYEPLRALGTTLLFLHHTVKRSEQAEATKNAVNGSQAIEAACRSMLHIGMGNAPSSRALTIVKGNEVPPELKNKPQMIAFDGTLRLFTGLIGPTSQTSLQGNQRGNVKYDRSIWGSRLAEIVKTMTEADGKSPSIRSVHAQLVKLFPDGTPGESWTLAELKKQFDGDMPASPQLESLESSRPVSDPNDVADAEELELLGEMPPSSKVDPIGKVDGFDDDLLDEDDEVLA